MKSIHHRVRTTGSVTTIDYGSSISGSAADGVVAACQEVSQLGYVL